MKQHIENSDRGLTINKSLAWTMACGLIGVGLYLGTGMATLSSGLSQIQEATDAASTARLSLEVRVRALENESARSVARFEGFSRSLDEIKDDQKENNRLLRALLNQSERGKQ